MFTRLGLAFTLLFPSVFGLPGGGTTGMAIASSAETGSLGSLHGRVEEATGEGAANVVVILACTCLPGPRRVITDARGDYEFVALPPGDYRVEALGSSAVITQELELELGAELRMDLQSSGESAPGLAAASPSAYAATMAAAMEAVAMGRDFTGVLWHNCGITPDGEQAALPDEAGRAPPPRPARAGFELERSLLDDGGQRALLGGPRLVIDLL